MIITFIEKITICRINNLQAVAAAEIASWKKHDKYTQIKEGQYIFKALTFETVN